MFFRWLSIHHNLMCDIHSLHKMKCGDCQHIVLTRPIYASKLHLYHLWSYGTLALCIKIVGKNHKKMNMTKKKDYEVFTYIRDGPFFNKNFLFILFENN